MALTAKKVYAILKRQISDMEAKLNSPVRYRGTVATADLLPLNPDIGDMYNIESKSIYGEAGMNVAWNGVVWDTMGAPIDMSLYLTKEEAETVIQRLVTEYFEKNPVKPGATTEQAQQIEQNKTDIASLKTETNSLKESISTKITKFYASSQGETHLADSDDGKIMDMMVYGKSEQKQYSGKNLLNYDAWKGITVTKGTAIFENNGVTLTATRDDCYTNFESDIFGIAKIPVSEGEVVTLSWEYDGKDGNVLIFPNGIVGDHVSVKNRAKKISYTVPNGVTFITFRFGVTNAGDTISYKNIQIEKGSEATSYEPYTGGIPSPNPSYPQEILSVKNPTVKVCGKNLLDVNLVKTNFNVKIHNGVVEQIDADTRTDLQWKIIQLKSNDIIVSQDSVSIIMQGTRLGRAFTAEENITEIVFGLNGEKTDTTVRIPVKLKVGQKYVISCNLLNSTQGSIKWDEMMLEEGSTPTAYEPYHEQTVTLPYDLYGIKVTSGGNVAINGQQYASDYFDVERGKLVRMCKRRKLFEMSIQDWGTGDNGARKDWYVDVEKYDDTAYIKRTIPCLVSNLCKKISQMPYPYFIYETIGNNGWQGYSRLVIYVSKEYDTFDKLKEYIGADTEVVYQLKTPEEIDLTEEEIAALKALATYYPTTNISVNSEQLDGYTVFNYPISMENGWNYVKQQIGDTREYIYDMDARTQDTDLQAAEAYVNSEYAVALTELEV